MDEQTEENKAKVKLSLPDWVKSWAGQAGQGWVGVQALRMMIAHRSEAAESNKSISHQWAGWGWRTTCCPCHNWVTHELQKANLSIRERHSWPHPKGLAEVDIYRWALEVSLWRGFHSLIGHPSWGYNSINKYTNTQGKHTYSIIDLENLKAGKGFKDHLIQPHCHTDEEIGTKR